MRDGDNVKVYFDGSLVGEETATFPLGDLVMFDPAQATQNPTIGGLTRSANGLIDDVRIYNHALTALEIEEINPVTVQDKLATTWGQIKERAW